MKSLKGANWEINWGFSTAVMRWAIDPALFVSIENAESCLPQVFDDAFAGRFGRLREREDMKPLAAVLPKVIDSLRQRMDTVNLKQEAKLPPVVWLRLFREAGVSPVDVAMRAFERWQKQMRANGLTILYCRFDATKKKFVGTKSERDGLGKAIGFTVEELLTEQRAAPRNWPYCYRWKCVTKSAKVLPRPPLLVEKAFAKPSRAVAAELTNVLKNTAPPRKRAKRSRKSIERTCGKPLIAGLEECLQTEYARKNSVLELKGRNRRDYKSQLSLDGLVAMLKQRYGKQLVCSDSTLKRALPYFVACPRGRPGGMG
jgi:hypothetical protein